jgi:histidinol-phosphatase (PHP family)
MALTNYHIHSIYCDGQDDLESIVIEAIHRGFKAIGFSSHCPMPVENHYTMKYEKLAQYCQEVRILKSKYSKLIQIYLGLEIDFIENVISPASPIVLFQQLDFTIGTVHFLWGKDGNKVYQLNTNTDAFLKTVKEGFHSNPASLIRTYFASIRRMVETSKPTIVGHLDLIKVHNNGYVVFDADTDFYQAEVENTLRVIKANNSILEVNTRGFYKGSSNEFSPAAGILKKALELNIPVTVNTDAHSKNEIDSALSNAYEYLREIGFTSAYALIDGSWNPYFITEYGLNTEHVYHPTILSEGANG